ncbi:MAG: DUF4249 family protein [Candidatus Glassbacteria bacterium]|nr:DUF4249 family protein [Candidatus Glassbacteria bacterium]
MNKSLAAVLLLAILAAAACTEDTPFVPESDVVVIRGYLYADEPVTEIQLASTVGLGSEDSVGPPVSDADVKLIKEGNVYSLVPTPGREGYYHYPGTGLTVNTGDRFRIEVAYYGKLASAETAVPPAPAGVAMTVDELVIQDFSAGGFGFGRRFMVEDTSAVRVTWLNQDNSAYYVALENVETDPQAIETGMPFGRPMRIISIPITGDEYIISLFSVTHYGRHKAKVYRVNQEYVDLFASRQQDTRDLNEPLTNVVNGLGVFTAFNSDSAFFTVVHE